MPHQSGAPFASVRSFPKEQWYRAGVVFFSPPPPPFPSFALTPTVRVKGGKTFCASFCASLIAGSRRAFLCVDWPCRLCLFVKCKRCERLLLVEVCKAFLFVFCCCSCWFFFGFRTTNVKERTDHSVSLRWKKRFEHFQRGKYFSDNCAFELWVDFRLLSPGWIKTRLYSFISSYGYFFYMPRFLNLPSRCRTSFIPVFSQRTISLTRASEMKLVRLKLSRK